MTRPSTMPADRRLFCHAGLYLALLAAVTWPCTAQAQTQFTATGSNADYATGSNWSGGVVPTGTATDVVIGSGSATRSALFQTGTTFSARNLSIGSGTGSVGTLTLGGSGTLTFTGGEFPSGVYIGQNGGTGTLNINSGLFQSTSGSTGDLTLASSGSATSGYLTVSGGTATAFRLIIGDATNATAVVTLNSGMINMIGGAGGRGNVIFGGGYATSASQTTFNLNGGSLATTSVSIFNTTSATFNFNGGVIVATRSTTNFLGSGITYNVLSGGAKFDTNGNNITVAQTLRSGSSAGGGLQKLGSGTLTLSASNGYTGTTSIDAGTLSLGNANALSGGGNLTFAGGTLQYGSGITTDLSARIKSSSGAVAVNTGSNATITFASTIDNSNTGGLTKTGTGTLALSASNGYTGTTNINAGTLSLGNANALSGTGNLTFTGGTLQYGSGITTDLSARIKSSSGAVAVDTGSNATITFASTIDNSNTGGLTKTGTGTLTLSASNGYTGLTKIDAGTLSLGNANALSGGGNITFGGGSLQFSVNNTSDYSGRIKSSGSAISIDTNGNNVTFATSFDNTNTGGFTKLGSGTLSMTGGASAFTGPATISQGAVSVATGVTGGALSSANSLTIASGATLAVSMTATGAKNPLPTNAPWTINGSLTISAPNNLGQDYFNTMTLNSGTVTGSGAASAGYGWLFWQSGATVIATGTSAIAGASGIGFAGGTVNTPNAGDLLTISAAVGTNNAKSGGLTKTGSGTLLLSASSTYTGATTISAGTLALGSAGSITSSGTVTVGNAGSTGAVLDLTAMSSSYAFGAGQRVQGIGTINIGAGKTVSSAGIWAPGNSIGSNTVTGNLSLTGTSQFELGTPGTSTSASGTSDFTAVSGTLSLGGNLALIDNANANSLGSYGAGTYRLFTYGAVSGSYASITAANATTRGGIALGGSGTSAGQGVFLNVYNLSSAAASQTINLGNGRVGTALTGSVTLTNSAPTNATFTETLSTGNFSATTSGFTTSGSASNIAGGGSGSGNLLVGLGSSFTAGAQSGTTTLALFSNAVNSSGLARQSITAQAITITGTVYDFARASYTGGAYAFGNVRTGSAATAQNVAIGNSTITNASFQDLLNVSGLTTNSAVTAAGFNNLAASTGGSTTQNLSLSANTATAGSLASTVNLTLVSNANGVAGLSNGTATTVGSPAAITTTGGVYDFARANFSGTTLNFGVVHLGASVTGQNVAFGNQTVTNASYQDSLDVSATTGNARVTATGFTGLAASSGGATTNNLAVSVSTATAGSLASTLSLTLTSNANNVAGLSNGTAVTVGGGSITTTGSVFSGTASWNVNGGGSWGTGASANWTSVESVSAAPGTFAGYTTTDSATFGTALTGGTASILLDGATPSLASIAFANTAGRYVIDQGTGGSLTLAAASGKPTVSVVAGVLNEIKTAILGTSGLQKTGLGTLVLSGSNTYSGGTDISAGTLAVNGSLGGAVNVASGGVLGGSGVLNGLVTVAAGGILAPGNSPGTLTLNSGLSLDAASILNFELNAANNAIGGGVNDLIVVTGDFTLAGILNVAAIGDFSTSADFTKWRLFNYSGGTFSNNGLTLGSMPSVGATGKYFQIDTATAGQVNLVIVPEPGALALAGVGVAAAVWALRRRRAQPTILPQRGE